MNIIFENFKQSAEYKCTIIFEDFEKKLVDMFTIDGELNKTNLKLVDHDVNCSGTINICYMTITLSDESNGVIYELILNISLSELRKDPTLEIKEFDLEIKLYEGSGKDVSKRITIEGVPVESFSAQWITDTTNQALSELGE